MTIRSVAELASPERPAWPQIQSLIETASAATAARPVDADRAHDVLHRLQITAGSFLGAMALHSGGIIADHGWFRLYGGGSPGLSDLATVNGLAVPTESSEPPGLLYVGDDALGGRFAVDGGALGITPGEVCYFGPDTLSWVGLGGGHADVVSAALEGSLGETFADLRWPGWESETADLAADQGISLYPPPFTVEGADRSAARRSVVPLEELFAFHRQAAQQMGGQA